MLIESNIIMNLPPKNKVKCFSTKPANFDENNKHWRFVQDDEHQADVYILPVELSDSDSSGQETQKEQSEYKQSQEDVLPVPDVYDETQELEETCESNKNAEEIETEVYKRFRLKFTLPQIEGKTKPVACFYRKREVLDRQSDWNELYSDLIVWLYVEHTSAMKRMLNKSLNTGKRLDFADKQNLKKLRTPVRITSNFYVETHGSTSQILNKIKLVFELCGIDLNDLEIWYRKK